eukprot:12905238-Prorocentrum_lima.AAC.1
MACYDEVFTQTMTPGKKSQEDIITALKEKCQCDFPPGGVNAEKASGRMRIHHQGKSTSNNV